MGCAWLLFSRPSLSAHMHSLEAQDTGQRKSNPGNHVKNVIRLSRVSNGET